MTVTVRELEPTDETRWRELWRGYCEFYGTDIPAAVTDDTWARLLATDTPFFGLVACEDDAVVGIVNCVLHPITWAEAPVCYLEDLFVTPDARNRGAGRALIEAVAARGRAEGWHRVYWMTDKDNAVARALYDRIAEATRWVRYDLPLAAPA